MTQLGTENDPGTIKILLRSGGEISGTEIIELADAEGMFMAISSDDGTVVAVPSDNIAAVVLTGELAAFYREKNEVRQ